MNTNELTPRMRRLFDRALSEGKSLIIIRNINEHYLCIAHEDIDNKGAVAGVMPSDYRTAFIVRPKGINKAGCDHPAANLILFVLKLLRIS